MITLSKRMHAVADLVPGKGVVCDVGCDHGYLPIYLLQSKKCCKAIAMDIGKGPLQAAQTNIEKYDMTGKITTRLSDGLKELSYGEAASVVIAGMGGGLVLHILSDSLELAKSMSMLVLQPQSELYEVRKFLQENGFVILEEDMVLEEGKYYPMMQVCFMAGVIQQTLSEAELYFGPKLIEKKHPVLKEFLNRELSIQEKVLAQLLEQKETEAILQRTTEVKAYIQLIQSTIGEVA